MWTLSVAPHGPERAGVLLSGNVHLRWLRDAHLNLHTKEEMMSLSHPTMADPPLCPHIRYVFQLGTRRCNQARCKERRRRIFRIMEAEAAWAPYTSYSLAVYPEVLDALAQLPVPGGTRYGREDDVHGSCSCGETRPHAHN